MVPPGGAERLETLHLGLDVVGFDQLEVRSSSAKPLYDAYERFRMGARGVADDFGLLDEFSRQFPQEFPPRASRKGLGAGFDPAGRSWRGRALRSVPQETRWLATRTR